MPLSGPGKGAAMFSFTVAAGEGAHRVEALCALAGPDLCLCLAGGESPHIGAAALAVPRESLRGGGEPSASASVLCVTGHKEDELARDAALRAPIGATQQVGSSTETAVRPYSRWPVRATSPPSACAIAMNP